MSVVGRLQKDRQPARLVPDLLNQILKKTNSETVTMPTSAQPLETRDKTESSLMLQHL